MGKMYAELFGKETGYCHGRGGSMHIADVTKGNLGANGIVGAGFPSRSARASRSAATKKQVVACFFGDAASNQGTFHEAPNMSKAFNLPIIWVCENNLYGLSTPIGRGPRRPLSDRAKGYSMAGVTVTAWTSRQFRRRPQSRRSRPLGPGPHMIETNTYRYFGQAPRTIALIAPAKRSRSGGNATPWRATRSLSAEGDAMKEELVKVEWKWSRKSKGSRSAFEPRSQAERIKPLRLYGKVNVVEKTYREALAKPWPRRCARRSRHAHRRRRRRIRRRHGREQRALRRVRRTAHRYTH